RRRHGVVLQLAMAKVSYVPLGRRVASGIEDFLQLCMETPPGRWPAAVLGRLGITGRSVVIAIPWIWLLLFFLIPFVIVLKISFADTRLGVPPYTPLWEWSGEHYLQLKLNIENYLFLAKDSLYLDAF